MKLSDAGLQFVVGFEGFSEDAYEDPGSANGLPITIGYGSTRWEDGSPIQKGQTITRERAAEMLRAEIAETESAVYRAVVVPLAQSQFDALVSFAYNVGIGAFRSSTLLRKLNAGDEQGAANEFLRWDKNDGKVMRGLTRRREEERALFLSGESVAPVLEPAAPPPEPVAPAAPALEDPTYQPSRRPPMTPVVAALLPSVVSMLPELAKLFGSGSAVSERNIKAAEKVAEAVVAATKAPNLQGAVERMEADPQARAAAREAVAPILDLVEAGGGGIAGARTFNVQAAGITAWRMPAVWVTVALLLPVYAVVGAVLFMPGWSNEIRLQVVTAVLVVISVVSAYWLGSSSGSARKTDIIANEQRPSP